MSYYPNAEKLANRIAAKINSGVKVRRVICKDNVAVMNLLNMLNDDGVFVDAGVNVFAYAYGDFINIEYGAVLPDWDEEFAAAV